MGRVGDAFGVLLGKRKVQRPDVAGGAYYSSGTGAGPTTISQAEWVKAAGEPRNHPVIAIMCDWLARQFLQAPWSSGYENPDEPGEYKDEPDSLLSQLLKTCNPIWGARQTWSAIIADRFNYEQAFIYKARASDVGNLPAELYWLPAKRITVVAETDPLLARTRPIRCYRFMTFRSGEEEYLPDDIIHLRGRLDENNPLVGNSTFNAQLPNSAAINAGTRWTAGILDNGTAGKIVSPKVSVERVMAGEMPDEKALNEVARKIKKYLSGRRVGGVEAVSLPIELFDAGASPEDMMADTIMDRPEAMLLASKGLNPLALGLPSAANSRTYANYKEALKDAWDHGVIPFQDSICEDLDTQLGREFDDSGKLRIWCERRDISALQEDASDRMNRATTGYTATLFKRNEGRVQAGGEALPQDDPDGELYFGEQTEQAKKDAQEAFEQQQQAFADQQAQVGGDAAGEVPPPTPASPVNGKPKREPVAA